MIFKWYESLCLSGFAIGIAAGRPVRGHKHAFKDAALAATTKALRQDHADPAARTQSYGDSLLDTRNGSDLISDVIMPRCTTRKRSSHRETGIPSG
jgi:hypothetical protein